MTTIYKYELQASDTQKIGLPNGFQILSVQIQHGYICFWAVVNPEALIVERTIHIRRTGDPMPEVPVVFLGTIQLDSYLVFHVFLER